MKIVNRKIAELQFAHYNPRQLTEKQHADLKESLEKFGLQEPIVVNMRKDRENVIVGGHQRVRIWKELGHKTIPTVEVKLNTEDEREFNIRLNKNTGEWDWDQLANHFEHEELNDFGFTDRELRLMDGEEEKGTKTQIDINTLHKCPECKYEW